MSDETRPDQTPGEGDKIAHNPNTDTAQGIGEIAVTADPPSEQPAGDDGSDKFYLNTPEVLYDEHRLTSRNLESAKEQVTEVDDRNSEYGWVAKKLSHHAKWWKARSKQVSENLQAAQNDYDQVLEESKKHMDSMHEQANEYASAYQNYANIQSALSEATGAPVCEVKDIKAFIAEYGGYNAEPHGSIKESGVYGALRDFFTFTPKTPGGLELNGRYTRYDRPLPRPDIGIPLGAVLGDVEENDQLLKITDEYVPSIRNGQRTYETVKAPPERAERYVRLTPELRELFDTISPDSLNFVTPLYTKKPGENQWNYPAVAEIGSRYELTTAEQLKAEQERQNLPFSATVQYETGGAYQERVWQSVEVGAESEEELRARVLNHLLENLSMAADIQVNGERVDLREFLGTKRPEENAPVS